MVETPRKDEVPETEEPPRKGSPLFALIGAIIALVLGFFGLNVDSLPEFRDTPDVGDRYSYVEDLEDIESSADSQAVESTDSEASMAPSSAADASTADSSVSDASSSDSGTKTIDGYDLIVTVIDVGQADSILVSCGGENLLIDAGDTDGYKPVKAVLDSYGITRLDYVIVTHPHADHIGSMAKVINNYEVGTVIMSDIPEKLIPTTKSYENMLNAIEKQGCELMLAEAGEKFSIGDAECTILGPVGEYDDLNNYSVVTRMVYGKQTFLFVGDMEAEAEADLLKSGAELQAKVLKMGHHGSSSSTSQAFFDKVAPKYCVISVGEGNDYGHPHRETLQLLEDNEIEPLRTDERGNITFRVKNGRIYVRTQK